MEQVEQVAQAHQVSLVQQVLQVLQAQAVFKVNLDLLELQVSKDRLDLLVQ